jgi:hypothetical protein
VTSSSGTAGGVDGYFIQGTVLTLYTNNPTDQIHAVDIKQVLNADTSFVFEQGKWRSALQGSSVGNGAANVGDVVQQFLDATPNTNSAAGWPLTTSNLQQVLVVSNMLNYISNYNVWAYQDGFNNTSMKNYLVKIEGDMMSSIQGLYLLNAGGGNSYYPTNPFGGNCLP